MSVVKIVGYSEDTRVQDDWRENERDEVFIVEGTTRILYGLSV